MHTFVTVIHVVTCLLLVVVILIQQGKGAEISASFAGSSQTVFGSSGGANFFSRFTQVAAAIFFVTSVLLTLMTGEGSKSIFEHAGVPAPKAATAPAVPVPPAAAPPAAAPAQPAAK